MQEQPIEIDFSQYGPLGLVMAGGLTIVTMMLKALRDQRDDFRIVLKEQADTFRLTMSQMAETIKELRASIDRLDDMMKDKGR